MRVLFFLFALTAAFSLQLALYALFTGGKALTPRRSRLNYAFSLFCLILALGGFGSAMFISAPGPAEAVAWFYRFSFTWYASPPCLFLFTLLMLDYRVRGILALALLLPAAALVAVTAFHPAAIVAGVDAIPLGYHLRYNVLSPWNALNVLNFILFPAATISFLAAAAYAPGKNPTAFSRAHKAKPLLWFFIPTFVGPFLFGYLSRFFMDSQYPPVLPLFLPILLVGLAQALFRDDILELSSHVSIDPILASVFDAVVIVDAAGKIIDTNLGGQRHGGGLAAMDLRGGSLSLLLPHVRDPAAWLALHAGDREAQFETSFSFEPGQSRAAQVSVRQVLQASGLCLGYTVIAHDLSAEKKLETEVERRLDAAAALKSLERRFSNAFQVSPAGMVIVEQGSWRVLELNGAAAKILGHPEAYLVGQKLVDRGLRFENEDSKNFAERLVRNEAVAPHEVRIIRSDGSRVVVLIAASPLSLDGRKTVVISLVDITELETLRMELAKAQKLESIGVLAGGLAHDFNNILTAVLGNVSLARMSVDEGDEAWRALSSAEAACLRARDLSRQLLTFSKGGEPTQESVDILTLVREAVRMAVAGTSILPSFSADVELSPILADASQLMQVFSNIAINAVQAMEGKGALSVRISIVRNPEDLADGDPLGELAVGEYMAIEFADTGPGIAEEMLVRIFDPYITTKRSGSGLGLAICYSIVRRHRGLIRVSSEMGKGSRFIVYLPAIQAVMSEKKSAAMRFGKGAVLLMDDDYSIRSAASRMLERLGYEPTVCPEGAAAVAAFKEARAKGRSFCAVILDLTVPGGMGGVDTASLIRALDPSVPIFVSSGYSDTPVLADYAAYGFDGILGKPYGIEELARRLSEG